MGSKIESGDTCLIVSPPFADFSLSQINEIDTAPVHDFVGEVVVVADSWMADGKKIWSFKEPIVKKCTFALVGIIIKDVLTLQYIQESKLLNIDGINVDIKETKQLVVT